MSPVALVLTVPCMNTITTPTGAALAPAAPERAAAGQLPVPSEFLFLEATQDWWWSANRLENMRLPIVGGLPQVRMLIRALDGDAWPWTTIGTSSDHWFQVLGTAGACTIELGDLSQVHRVAHAYRPDPSRHLMPAGCRWWLKSCRTDEVFTALEAASIGIRHLLRHPFRQSLVLHDIRPGRPGSRR